MVLHNGVIGKGNKEEMKSELESEPEKKKQPDFSKEMEFLADMEAEGFQLDDYSNKEVLAKFRAGPNNKSEVLGKLEQEQKQISVIVTKEKGDKTELLEQEQKQLSVIVIKEKADKTEFQEQEQHDVIVGGEGGEGGEDG